ncbi:MAG TPA: hypothetical protein VKW04_18210 [Planctomycetota bacterium]|nr:hypothetical protein [Planctomycetota bacterium]
MAKKLTDYRKARKHAKQRGVTSGSSPIDVAYDSVDFHAKPQYTGSNAQFDHATGTWRHANSQYNTD